jgi:hypothetical protein
MDLGIPTAGLGRTQAKSTVMRFGYAAMRYGRSAVGQVSLLAEHIEECVRFEVFTVVTMKNGMLRRVTLARTVGGT